MPNAPNLGRTMTEPELRKWREEYILLKRDYEKEIPELQRIQKEHAQAIGDLQTAEHDENQRMKKVAESAIETYMGQKGRQLERWTPIIVQILITAGILGAAYIGYQGIIAQVAKVIGP